MSASQEPSSSSSTTSSTTHMPVSARRTGPEPHRRSRRLHAHGRRGVLWKVAGGCPASLRRVVTSAVSRGRVRGRTLLAEPAALCSTGARTDGPAALSRVSIPWASLVPGGAALGSARWRKSVHTKSAHYHQRPHTNGGSSPARTKAARLGPTTATQNRRAIQNSGEHWRAARENVVFFGAKKGQACKARGRSPARAVSLALFLRGDVLCAMLSRVQQTALR